MCVKKTQCWTGMFTDNAISIVHI